MSIVRSCKFVDFILLNNSSYIKLGDLSKAAKYLGRRKDVGSLEVAVELALLSDDKELSDSLAEQAITEALLNSDCTTGQTLIKAFPRIEVYQLC